MDAGQLTSFLVIALGLGLVVGLVATLTSSGRG